MHLMNWIGGNPWPAKDVKGKGLQRDTTLHHYLCKRALRVIAQRIHFSSASHVMIVHSTKEFYKRHRPSSLTWYCWIGLPTIVQPSFPTVTLLNFASMQCVCRLFLLFFREWASVLLEVGQRRGITLVLNLLSRKTRKKRCWAVTIPHELFKVTAAPTLTWLRCRCRWVILLIFPLDFGCFYYLIYM